MSRTWSETYREDVVENVLPELESAEDGEDEWDLRVDAWRPHSEAFVK